MFPEYTRMCEQYGDTDSEDSTSSSSPIDMSWDGDDNTDEDLVQEIGSETFEITETKKSNLRVGNGIRDGELAQKLQHLPVEKAK